MLTKPNNSICKRYNSINEDSLHCLRNCTTSTQLWNSSEILNPDVYIENNVHSWFKLGLVCLNHLLFFVRLWWLWRAQNSTCIVDDELLLIQIKHNVSSLANLMSLAFHCSSKTSNYRWVTWHPTRDCSIILNVDGSSIDNPGPSGFGGLLRHGDGAWIHEFMVYIR